MSKFNFFDGNKHNARDRMMNEVGDAMEGNMLAAFKRVRFKGVILNGYETGLLKQAPDQFLFNAPKVVLLADGLARLKLRFVIHEDHYDTNIGNAFTSFFGVSPFEKAPSGLVHERINRMPFAYTDLSDTLYSQLHFGAIVNIYERFGHFFIGKPTGRVQSSPAPYTPPTPTTQQSFNKGVKVKLPQPSGSKKPTPQKAPATPQPNQQQPSKPQEAETPKNAPNAAPSKGGTGNFT